VQCDEFPRFELLYGMHSTGGLLPRFWLRMRTLLQMCDSGRRERHFSTGGLRPPLLVAQCRFAGENHSRGAQRTSLRKTTFALHKRTFSRAAGVSPPWELLTPVQ
jgi:hypothetical protein